MYILQKIVSSVEKMKLVEYDRSCSFIIFWSVSFASYYSSPSFLNVLYKRFLATGVVFASGNKITSV